MTQWAIVDEYGAHRRPDGRYEVWWVDRTGDLFRVSARSYRPPYRCYRDHEVQNRDVFTGGSPHSVPNPPVVTPKYAEIAAARGVKCPVIGHFAFGFLDTLFRAHTPIYGIIARKNPLGANQVGSGASCRAFRIGYRILWTINWALTGVKSGVADADLT